MLDRFDFFAPLDAVCRLDRVAMRNMHNLSKNLDVAEDVVLSQEDGVTCISVLPMVIAVKYISRVNTQTLNHI